MKDNQNFNNESIEKKDEPPSKFRRLFSLIYNDIKTVYKNYPITFILIISILFILLFFLQFKPVILLLFFIILYKFIFFLSDKTDFQLGFEHVSIASILFSYYIGLSWSLFSTLILMIIIQARNNKVTFLGILIDGGIWISFCFLAYGMRGFEIGTVALILPIGRFVLKEIISLILGFQLHDLIMDSLNVFYQIGFIRYIGAIIGLIVSVS